MCKAKDLLVINVNLHFFVIILLCLVRMWNLHKHPRSNYFIFLLYITIYYIKEEDRNIRDTFWSNNSQNNSTVKVESQTNNLNKKQL